MSEIINDYIISKKIQFIPMRKYKEITIQDIIQIPIRSKPPKSSQRIRGIPSSRPLKP